MTTLTPEQRQEIQRAGEEPDRLRIPRRKLSTSSSRRTSTTVAVPLLDDTRSAYSLTMRVFGEDGWDDPQMDEYNVLDSRSSLVTRRFRPCRSWPRRWSNSMGSGSPGMVQAEVTVPGGQDRG